MEDNLKQCRIETNKKEGKRGSREGKEGWWGPLIMKEFHIFLLLYFSSLGINKIQHVNGWRLFLFSSLSLSAPCIFEELLQVFLLTP